jgi:hypothetical protein
MRTAIAIVIAGVAVGFAPAAHADHVPLDQAWKGVCKLLSDHLTGDPMADEGVVLGVAQGLMTTYGLESGAAGDFIYHSATDHCPQYVPNLDAVVKRPHGVLF